ncbi:MAG: hypothetical protein WA869_29165 [Alloacidobacterium sp.]|jgi:hypothetical protein
MLRRDLNRAAARIKLRLHLEARNHESLMKSMGKLFKLLDAAPNDLAFFRDEFGALSKDVEIQMAQLHAREWQRVKSGEVGYRVAKAIALIVLLCSLVFLLLLRSSMTR